MAFADARAKLRKEFRQRLSVGAWNDMFTHIFKRERFINPTPAAEAKLLGEKMTRNAAFREVRAQAIKRRLDEGEALGSRAAAGRGTAEGEGIRDNVHDGRMAGSFTVAGLEAVAATAYPYAAPTTCIPLCIHATAFILYKHFSQPLAIMGGLWGPTL